MKICRIALLAAALLAVSCGLSGCWDSVELNRRAVVSAVAVDKGEKPEERFKLSFQVIVSDEISGQNSRGASPVALFSGSGRTMHEAFAHASRQVARYLSLGHIRLVVISEEFAREGIVEILDVLERNGEARMTMLMFVSKGPARDVLNTTTVFGKIPANDLVEKIETTSQSYGGDYQIQVDDVIRGIELDGGGPLLNGVRVRGNKEAGGGKGNVETIRPKAILQVLQLAVFRGDRLVGWLNESDSNMTSLLVGGIEQIPAIAANSEKEYVFYNVYLNKKRIKIDLSDPEHPVFHIKFWQQATIKESTESLDLADPAVLRMEEDRLEREIKRKLEHAVKTAQKLGSDYLGFSRHVERQAPAYWRRHKERWETLFARSEFRFEVQSVIRSTEMRTRSIGQNQQ